MSYLVLARKYRPQKFDSVIDQDHITRTLSNAIAADRMSHAILFTGPRGTGKTTVARILAKSMNCAEGPTSIPCDVCQSCREITTGRGVDVFEIDGASNNSVDQVRELRDNVKYMPAHSPYKIYIIDEVHMLSTPAFNALLKTLEEPPGHVMFVFATTEPHKIPVTILSRCQRHDFKRIRLDSMTNHMRDLCGLEGFDISDESLSLIAREAGGSMRDALSLLDQVMACSSTAAADKDVMELLGVIDRETIFNLSAALLDGRTSAVLQILDDIYDRGHDLKRLYFDLLEHFRNLIVVKLSRQTDRLIDLPAHEIQRMHDKVAHVNAAHLNQLFDLLFREEPAVKFSSQTKIALEMVCLRLLQAKPVLSIETLIDQLDKLRRELATTPDNRDGPTGNMPAAPPSANGSNENTAAENGNSGTSPPSLDRSDSRHAAEPPSPQSVWEKIKSVISADYPSLAANLLKCQLKQVENNRVIIGVTGNAFNLSMIQKSKNLEIIRKVCNDVFGQVMEIEIRAISEPQNNTEKKKDDNLLKNEALSHPLVAEALNIFNGKLIDVRILKEDDS